MIEAFRVTVVIPIFEVEPYIETCLDSIVNQTLEDLEVILVLKPGRDRSCEIAEYYADKYGWHCEYVQDDERQGESRNKGIDLASGKYIVFADSDDYIPPTAYEKMLEALEKTQADICLGRTLRFHSKNTKGWAIKGFDAGGLFSSRRVLRWADWPKLAFNGGPWNKMISLKFLRDNDISFPEKLLYEDVGFSLNLYSSDPLIVIERSVVYKWRVRLSGVASITQQRDDFGNLSDRLAVYSLVDDILEKKEISENLVKIWQLRKANDIMYYLDSYLNGTEFYRDCFRAEITPYLQKIPEDVFNKLDPTKKKYALLLREGNYSKFDKLYGTRSVIKVAYYAVKKSFPKTSGRVNKIKKFIAFPFKMPRIVLSDLMRVIKRRRWQYKIHPRTGLFYSLCRCVVRPKQNVFLYEGVSGRQYAGNEKYIYLEMMKNLPNATHVWAFQDKEAIERNRQNLSGAKLVVRGSIKYLYYLSKAGALFTGTSLPYYYKKQKGSLFIQSWHGTPLKLLGFDIKLPEAKQLNKNSTENVMYSQSKIWDYFIAPNKFTEEKFSSAYLYNGDVLKTGYPRNDIFYWPENKKQEISQSVRLRLNIPSGKKIALYAPTFRDGKKFGTKTSTVTFPLDIQVLKDRLGDEWVLVVRAHLLSGGKFDASQYGSFVVTAMVDEFDDPQELCLAADVLITDYSSIAFDYANTGKPMLFYTPDFESYSMSKRGFYFDPRDQFPGPFLSTSEEVANSILNINDVCISYNELYASFKEMYCSWEDGSASTRAVEAIISKNMIVS